MLGNERRPDHVYRELTCKLALLKITDRLFRSKISVMEQASCDPNVCKLPAPQSLGSGCNASFIGDIDLKCGVIRRSRQTNNIEAAGLERALQGGADAP